jgi:hypothetical protein
MMEYKTHTGSYQTPVIILTHRTAFLYIGDRSHTPYKSFPQTITRYCSFFDEPLSLIRFLSLVTHPTFLNGQHFPLLVYLLILLARDDRSGLSTYPTLSPLYSGSVLPVFSQTLSTQ